MILTIDIGNSRIKWGLWRDAALVASNAHGYDAKTLDSQLDQAWQGLEQPDAIILACVAGRAIENSVQAWLREHWQREARVFQTTSQFGELVHAYQQPGQHGADRWAAMIAARELYRRPLCVISCGTAVTLDVIDAAGKHLGGQILPGADLMFAALSQRLPALAMPEPGIDTSGYPAFASNTSDAINIGVLNMLAAGLDRASDQAREIMGADTKTLLTGGAATAIMPLMKTPVELQPTLVLRGLYLAAQAGKA